MKENIEEKSNEETDKINLDDNGDHKKAPPKQTKERCNNKNIFKSSFAKFEKKFYVHCIIPILIIIILLITKKIIFIKEKEDNNINIIHSNNGKDEEVNLNTAEAFTLIQEKNNIDINKFSSPQLRNPQNIKLIEKLEITLDLEYEKFIHLKIKDSNNKRWEVPENDVLNQKYLKDLIDNKSSLSRYSKILDSEEFYIEFLSNKNVDEDYQDMRDINPFAQDYKFNNTHDFSFRLMKNDNQQFYYFTTSENFLYSDTYINFQSKLTSDDIFGFGERTHDFKLNEGIYTIWSYDAGETKYDDGKGGFNGYSHQPIGLHKTKYENLWLGFVFLNTNAQDVEIKYNKNNNNANDTEVNLIHKTIGGIIDYYIIVDNSPEEIIKNIKFLLGTPPLPPYWTLGNHQSRYGYKTFEEFKEVYDNFKKYQIPIDVMWLDIDAMDNYEIFTINKQFEKIPPFVKDEIHKDGGKFVPIVDIGISYENNNSEFLKLGSSLDIFIKSNYTKKPLIAKVWPGKTVFPDFSNPKIDAFWKKGLEDYHNIVNYDGIWLDMNEPANLLGHSNISKCDGEIVSEEHCKKESNQFYDKDLPYFPGYRENLNRSLSYRSISENALVYNNLSIYNVKPMIAFYQTKTTYEFLDAGLRKRPFILSRSASLGSGKYTYHWSGDNLSNFDNLKNSISSIFNFNIFGIPFTGSDICGFMENASKELCIRWYNLGVFYPFSRNHNFFNSKDQYPWSFDDEKNDTINIIKKSINIRYSLLRYMYSQFFLISLNDKGSFFKPVMFEFPEDEASYEDIESKIMFGESFLTIAFYEENENNKKIEFPDSNFNIYPSGKSIIKGDKVENNEKTEKVENDNIDNTNKSTNGEEEENEDEIDRYKDEEKEPKKKIAKKKNNREKYIRELSGKLDEIHIFLRGGYIVPYQDVFNKYILNTMKLREEKINLIINIDQYGTSIGEIFFDNDGKDTIKNALYYKVDIFYSDKKMTFTTTKYNMTKYEFDDHIVGVVEFWRASEVFKIEDEKDEKTKIIKSKLTFNNNKNNPENLEGVYDKENDKVIFEISTADKNISIFDIKEMIFN